MQRSELTEFHYITPIANLATILTYGILSRQEATQREETGEIAIYSIADPEILERRSWRRVPNGQWLDHYANLYFNARNAMLFRVLRGEHDNRTDLPNSLIILRISTTVLDIEGVILTDKNAAVGAEPRFYSVSEGLAALDDEEVFAEYWRDRHHRQRMMAEVLVPYRVPVEYIAGAYVSEASAIRTVRLILNELHINFPLEIQRYMFFLEPGS